MWFIIVALMYIALFVSLAYWFTRSSEKKENDATFFNQVTLIAAFRNEKQHIQAFCNSIAALKWPSEKLRVILVDDGSDDESAMLAEKILRHKGLNFSIIPNEGKGKKNALKTAVNAAPTTWILFTDADVVLPVNWIESMFNCCDTGTRMVCSPIKFTDGNTWFKRWMQLEFAGLQASGAALIAAGYPVMANGAGMLVDKKAWMQAEARATGKNYPTGDDVFLLHALWKLYPQGIRFCFSPGAIVSTQAPANLKSFIGQRLRWASKASGYKSVPGIALSLFIFLYHVLLLGTGVAMPFTSLAVAPFAVLFMAKLITDAFFFFCVLPFFSIKFKWFWLPLDGVVHTMYIVFIGAVSQFYQPRWKEPGQKM